MAAGKLLIQLSLLSKIISLVHADLTPTAPAPGQTFTAGKNCTIMWNVDESGSWKNTTIDLMSGSNTNMSLVRNVVSGLDGTDSSLTPYNWTCPEVDPYSAIYFYQFTNGDQTSGPLWTTRFTINSPNNETVPPPNATQPDGDPIPWGIGHLLDNTTTPTTNSSVGNETISRDPANVAHFEQINIQDLYTKAEADDGAKNSGEDMSMDSDALHRTVVRDSAPTLDLPPSAKKVEFVPASNVALLLTPSGTFSGSDEQRGLKLANRNEKNMEVSSWVHLYPLLLILIVLH